ncbi:hypothetical protein JL09_g5636 [Pichia kudriavzevii]|uniref:Uncharacterized protein n=1 Tax=Pichia kudriavzevii TaxID=4909 RepID=A0A099NT62_PICKU|nr:hypothetical protein JL09_g5636 [Pichia kudriavzevii]
MCPIRANYAISGAFFERRLKFPD